MKFSKKIMATIMAGAIAAPAFSGSAGTSSGADISALNYAFADIDTTMVRPLSDGDMGDIKGDFLPFALPPAVIAALQAAGWGAVGGAATGAIVEASSNPDASTSDIVQSAGRNAVSGALLSLGGASSMPIVFRTTAVGLGLGWTAATAHGTPVVSVQQLSCSNPPIHDWEC